MEKFRDGDRVWLRSRSGGAYLHADEDGCSVSLRPSCESLRAAWNVHLLTRGSDTYNLLLLQSAAYGRYLTATGTPASRDHRVGLQDYQDLNDFEIRWFAISPREETQDILLRHMYFRGNLSVRPKSWFNNSAGGLQIQPCDHLCQPTLHMLWEVENIPPELQLAPQRQPQLPRNLSSLAIHDVRITIQNKDEIRSLVLMGNSLLNLKSKINGIVGSGYELYVRAGTYARLTLLLIDLPDNNNSIELVLVPTKTEIHNESSTAITRLGQIEWAGTGLSVGNVFSGQSASSGKHCNSSSVATKQVWLVGSAEEADHAISQWVLDGRPKHAAVTLDDKTTFNDKKNIMDSFHEANATALLEREDNTQWLREYRLLASVSLLPRPPKEVALHFGPSIHRSNSTLQPWILID